MATSTGVKKENARLYIYKGIENAGLGITPDMEIGRLYYCDDDTEELSALASLVGLKPSWLQNRLNGLAHFDLWGAPLVKAKKLCKIVTKEEVNQDWERIEEARRQYSENKKMGVLEEYKSSDLVLTNIGYVSFVSKSKGRGRLRRKWKEIELYRYCGAGWHTDKRFKFDEVAAEITERRIGDDELRCWVKEHCNRKGGKRKGIN